MIKEILRGILYGTLIPLIVFLHLGGAYILQEWYISRQLLVVPNIIYYDNTKNSSIATSTATSTLQASYIYDINK